MFLCIKLILKFQLDGEDYEYVPPVQPPLQKDQNFPEVSKVLESKPQEVNVQPPNDIFVVELSTNDDDVLAALDDVKPNPSYLEDCNLLDDFNRLTLLDNFVNSTESCHHTPHLQQHHEPKVRYVEQSVHVIMHLPECRLEGEGVLIPEEVPQPSSPTPARKRRLKIVEEYTTFKNADDDNFFSDLEKLYVKYFDEAPHKEFEDFDFDFEKLQDEFQFAAMECQCGECCAQKQM